MLNKLQEKMKALSDAAQAKAAENLLTAKVPEEIQKQRWNICQSCEKLYVPTSTCRLCGCFMQVKTWIPREACPAKKWLRHPIEK